MKWILIFFIGMASDEYVNLYAFPDSPFDSEFECKAIIYTYYSQLQIKVNQSQGTEGVEYPPLCITEKQWFDVYGNPT